MALPSVFEQKASQDLLARLEQITAQSQPKWGTMDSAKLLAHLNVTYDLAYERIPNKLNFFIIVLPFSILKINILILFNTTKNIFL